MKIEIKYIPNVLSKDGRETRHIDLTRPSYVLDCIRAAGLPHEGCRIVINGKLIQDPETRKIRLGDQILLLPEIKDPITSTIGAFLWAAFTQYFAVTLAVLTTGFSIYSALNRPKLPTFGSSGEGLDENSPTYAWDGMVTTQDPGLPIPVVYGKHPVPGNIINQFITTDGDNNYLNVLLGLCVGEVGEIGSLKINGQPSANYSGITLVTRVGTKDQSVIPGFEDQHNLVNVDQPLLQASPVEYTTLDNDVEGFIINLSFSGGLFQVNASTGASQSWAVTYKVEYKLTSSGSWIDLGNTTISHRTRTGFIRQYKKTGLAAGKYDIKVSRITQDSQLDPVKQGDVSVASVDELKPEDLRYPKVALAGIQALATNQLNNGAPNFQVTIEKGKNVRVPEVVDGFAALVDYEDYYWDPDYDSGNGAFRLFSDDTVLSWDGTTYVEAYSANPIWCMRDLLTDDLYGLGNVIETANIDDDTLLEMAKYCDEKIDDGDGGEEKRFRLDVVLDSRGKALDIINQLASVFRGIIFYSEGTIKIRIDKPDEIVQVFGMGNILKGRFSQSWESKREHYNRVIVQFANQDTDYRLDSVPFEEETAVNDDGPIPKEVRLFTTKLSYAKREARYALKVSRLIKRSISLRAATDAIAVQPGDLIAVSHDVPQIGYSGRAAAGSTSTTIKLDRQVTIEAATSYVITVQHDDDTIETFDITTGASTTDTLTIDGTWTKTPDAYTSKYIFGVVNINYKPYRVVSLQRMNYLEVEIGAIEYNEDVYDDTSIIVPETNYSQLTDEIQDVSDLALTEMIVEAGDGTLMNTIEVWFQHPSLASHYLNAFDRVRVYLSDDDGASWTLQDETKSIHSIIDDNIQTGSTYKVAVVSMNKNGQENPISDSPQEEITILGKLAPPSNVENFDVAQRGSNLRFTFDPIPDADLARYIIKKGSDWNTGDIIAERLDATAYEHPVGETGLQTYMIKALDTSGNESNGVAQDTIDVVPPPEMNFVNNFDPWSVNLNYLLTDCSLVWENRFNRGYVRPAIALNTSETWESLEASVVGWQEAIDAGDLEFGKAYEASGSFEMREPIDLETVFEFTILSDLDFFNVLGGSLTVQISTSENGVDYTAFANTDPSTQYRARYVKFKFILATSDTAHGVWFYGGTIFINAPQVKVAFGSDEEISISGTTIEFGVDFSLPPRVRVDIVNGVTGFVKINKTADDMTVQIFEDQAQTTPLGGGEIDWEARGV